ncbi:phosphatase PAP2 family protein [Falsiroseomonas oryzae]|uniref:phosphatase PAP2 family protein n=1 Tax=Falsiroseomonas oryzae TaxID=2766473 RepID=UPI0022EA5CF4|nr:phosphatase PAP2 family protein [Roseomonas sp. MO-31]
MIRFAAKRRAAGAAFLLMAALAPAGAGAQPATSQGIAPDAGRWRTWVLASGSQFRLPAPPDADATRAEIEQLRAMAGTVDAETRERILWWDSVAPSYRWNAIALEASLRAGLNANVASRHLAALHTALADAMVAAWDSKHAHGRARPAVLDPTLATVVPTPQSPSWPDEHAAAGAVAAAMLGASFPQRAAEFERLAEEASRMRLLAGVAFPSDVAAGTALGRQVAAAALERARNDRSALPWTGSVPTGPGLWNGTNPIMPQAATWRPWLLASPDEFRPPPPAAHDSPERQAELAQLRAFPRTPKTNADALFWEVAVGGLRNYEYWSNHTSRLLLENGLAADPPRAARTYALLHAAHYDAGVACWDAKYAYWAIRPFQLDPELRPIFATPNHPSYPAAHACYSMTAALVLSHLFPRDAASLLALGRESGESRIWAGIHYPSDVAAGQRLAQQVAGRAIERAQADVATR